MDHNAKKKGKTPAVQRRFALKPDYGKLFYKFPLDVFDHIPDILILQSLAMGHHACSFGAVLDDVEHLTSGNAFHGLGAGEIPWRRFQGRSQFAIAVPLFTVAHLAGHGFCCFHVNLFPGRHVSVFGFIAFDYACWASLGLPLLWTLGPGKYGVCRKKTEHY